MYHGSRDPRPQKFCDRIVKDFQKQLRVVSSCSQNNYFYPGETNNAGYQSVTLSPEKQHSSSQYLVKSVALELAELPLHQEIVRFAHQASVMGKKNLVVIPLFLSLGVHVTQDIPREIDLAKSQIQQPINIILDPPLGSYSGLETLVLEKFEKISNSTRILLAHGSRLLEANHKTEYLANFSQAKIAYWSTQPNLETAIIDQIGHKSQKIAIIPYFLFPGRITDAIAEKVSQLQFQFPETELILDDSLSGTETLAQLIFDNILPKI